jgi:hypothetical protein
MRGEKYTLKAVFFPKAFTYRLYQAVRHYANTRIVPFNCFFVVTYHLWTNIKAM